MWFIAVPVALALSFFARAIVLTRRVRRLDRKMVRDGMDDFVRLLADPATAGEVILTTPHRDDDDRTHDTMFTARHGRRQLSFILDTSRRSVRWWVLYEHRAPETGERNLRAEATFAGNDIPVRPIQELLKAARGERQAPPAPEPAQPPAIERHVDPFEPAEADPPPQPAQA